jgi:hypothetical protein
MKRRNKIRGVFNLKSKDDASPPNAWGNNPILAWVTNGGDDGTSF